MAGPFTWWANRKSRIGVSPAAKRPPNLPSGAEWFTSPPISAPEPEHIEYALEFMRGLQHCLGSQERNAALGMVSDWIRKARQLLHERVESQDGDLHTTDGLIIAACAAMGQMFGEMVRRGITIRPRWQEIRQALQARAARAKRERSTHP